MGSFFGVVRKGHQKDLPHISHFGRLCTVRQTYVVLLAHALGQAMTASFLLPYELPGSAEHLF